MVRNGDNYVGGEMSETNNVLDAQLAIARIEERIENWMRTTEDYRRTLCEKITELRIGQNGRSDKVNDLPCKARAEMYKGFGLTMKLVWTAIGITFGMIAAHIGWR